MAWTTLIPAYFPASTEVTSTQLNALVNDINWLHDAPACRVYNNSNFLVATSTLTAVTFNSERNDNAGIHSTSANTGRLTAPVDGFYWISANVSFASNATGFREVNLRLNGATNIGRDSKNAVNGSGTAFSFGALYKLAAGDYVEVVVFQNSGGNLNVDSASAYSPEFGMAFVSTG